MAHANHDYTLGLHNRVSDHIQDPVSVTELRARMRYIEWRVAAELPLGLDEQAAWDAWCAGKRRIRAQRRMEAATRTTLTEGAVRGMHGGSKAGERFLEPVRRGEGPRRRFSRT